MRCWPAALDCCLPPSWRRPPKTVLQYRMDELAKAFAAAHLAMDIFEDEQQIKKLKKAEKLAKQVHADVHPEGSFLRGMMRADSSSSDGSRPG